MAATNPSNLQQSAEWIYTFNVLVGLGVPTFLGVLAIALARRPAIREPVQIYGGGLNGDQFAGSSRGTRGALSAPRLFASVAGHLTAAIPELIPDRTLNPGPEQWTRPKDDWRWTRAILPDGQ
ncbi:hypothetical protein [Microbacterium halimionae]|nr:hypothetical protein [Microbacterium halimionae]NII94727.1 hypothetical protein [Microbacterium halimionae]